MWRMIPSGSITKVTRFAKRRVKLRTPYALATCLSVSLSIGKLAPVSAANFLFLSWLSMLIPSTWAPAASNLAISA